MALTRSISHLGDISGWLTGSGGERVHHVLRAGSDSVGQRSAPVPACTPTTWPTGFMRCSRTSDPQTTRPLDLDLYPGRLDRSSTTIKTRSVSGASSRRGRLTLPRWTSRPVRIRESDVDHDAGVRLMRTGKTAWAVVAAELAGYRSGQSSFTTPRARCRWTQDQPAGFFRIPDRGRALTRLVRDGHGNGHRQSHEKLPRMGFFTFPDAVAAVPVVFRARGLSVEDMGVSAYAEGTPPRRPRTLDSYKLQKFA